MKCTAVLCTALLLLVLATAQEEEPICDVSPEGTTVEPTSQNRVDKLIQRLQGKRSTIIIRKLIVNALKDPNSYIRRWVGRMAQDPRDEANFEEGDAGVEDAVPNKFIDVMGKIFGETRTVVGYLRTFGFFAKVLNKSPNGMENYNGAIPPCAITNAIKEFQVFNQLPADGVLTAETRRLMALDRCGNPDVECDTPACEAEKDEEGTEESEYLGRKKRFAVTRAFKTPDLTYYFHGYTDDLSVEKQREEIEHGFREWTEVAPLTFTEVDDVDGADFEIDFGTDNHGDKYSFDGPLGVLAHGFYPRKGHLHFDDAEQYTADEYSGINLYYVTTHEMGHALGIKHSDVRGAVMGPYYPGYSPDIRLQSDDITAIQSLYGSGQGSMHPLGAEGPSEELGPDNIEIWEGPSEELGPDNIELLPADDQEEDGCISRIDGAFNHPTEKYAYVFTGQEYVRLEADERNMPVVSEGYPRDIASEWPGLEDGVDAAFTDYHREKTFFFRGDKVYCWNWLTSTMELEAAPISDSQFAGLPGDIQGVASYRDYVIFIYAETYYLWTVEEGLIPGAQHWPYQGDRAIHVSGAFDSFLRGYFYTANKDHPEKYVLFKSRSLINDGPDASIVENYFYRKFDGDMNLEICA